MCAEGAKRCWKNTPTSSYHWLFDKIICEKYLFGHSAVFGLHPQFLEHASNGEVGWCLVIIKLTSGLHPRAGAGCQEGQP